MVTPDEMAEWIETAPAGRLGNALLALYQRQTADERATHDTRYHNKVGFNAIDADIMTSLSEWFIDGKSFTPKQTSVLRRLLRKYRRQLADIATKKQEQEASNDQHMATSV